MRDLIYKTSMDGAAPGATLPGDELPIPNIRADFLPFTSKIVEHSRYLLLAERLMAGK